MRVLNHAKLPAETVADIAKELSSQENLKDVMTSERTERGYYGNWQPFLTRMGVPKCS